MPGVLYQVNGPAVIYLSGGRISATGKMALGICRDRVQIRINQYENPIHADNAGPHIPADMQDMGKDALIRFTLSEFDPAVLDLMTIRGNAADPGSIGAIGLPLGSSGTSFRLHIPSNYKPWTFWTCVLRSREDAVGSEYSLIHLEVHAFALVGNQLTANGARLYSNTF